MLTVTTEFFPSEDVMAIKNWLTQPGAGLFRRAINNEIVKLQLEASGKLKASIDPDYARHRADAEKSLRRVSDLEKVIAEMDRAASKDFQPFVAKVATV